MNLLSIKKENLPSTLPELNKFILIGKEQLKSYRARVSAIDKAGLAKAVRDQALEDSQKMGTALLYAESKMGEILKSSTRGTFKKGGEKSLPEGITKKQSHFAQKLYENQELIEEVIADARDNEDIPTRTEVLRRAKDNQHKEKINKQKEEIKKGVENPNGLFSVISIDPPWPYGTGYDSENRRVASPYPEMSLEEISSINLPAEKDSIIWLWTTHRFLKDSFTLLDQWGFEYKATLVWDKQKMGVGAWVRMQCEFCLLGIKGSPVWENKSIRDIISEPRTSHSRKPESFYKMVDDNFLGRKLEYFSRTKRDGWEVFGDEVK